MHSTLPPSIWFLLTAIALLFGCGPGERTEPGAPPDGSARGPRNVLLVTLDTTRADCIACYGNMQVSTPNLDELASEGLRVENAYATAPMTLPSHASMLTGAYPFSNGVRNNTHFTLGFDNVTVAEVLHDAGWKTAAFVGATILLGRLGLSQGFDAYFDDMFSGISRREVTTPWASRKAANVNYDFLNWLDSLPQAEEDNPPGWFAWVHYYDPHFAYDPPEPYYTDYSFDLYLGEIAYMDHELGVILDELKSRGLYENTLIIAVGDHGEGLGDHGEVFHALWTYDSTLKVPFIISDPGTRGSPVVLDGPASVIDVYATVLQWCGLEAPSNPGVNLLAPEAQSLMSERAVYFESMEARVNYNWAGLRGVVLGKEKYIHTPIPEFYDLDVDPRETTNLYESSLSRARELKSGMNRLVDEWRTERAPAIREMSPEDVARLQSLGYLTGGAVPATGQELENIVDLPDLKSMRDVVDDVSILRDEGDAAFEVGDYETAKEKYRQALEYAEIYTVVAHLGEIAANEGDYDEAIRLLRRSVELGPTMAMSWYNLAVAYRNAGRHEDARRAFEQATAVSPSDPVNVGSYVAMALYDSQAGDWRSALESITTARGIDDKNRELIGYEASIRYRIGSVAAEDASVLADTLATEDVDPADPRVARYNELKEVASNQLKRGYELYSEFLGGGEGSASHYFEAGQCAIRQGDYRKALEWTRRAADLLPPSDPNRQGLETIAAELERILSDRGPE